MTDLTYLNKITLREEARYFFEQDFPEIAKDFLIKPNGEIEYGKTYSDYFGAYRHLYGSAVLTRGFGSLFSKALGDANELDFLGFRNNPASEKNQDLWNNSIGRQIGMDSPSGRLIADRIKAAFENGDVIIYHETDQREYSGETKCYNLDTADAFSQLLAKYSLNSNISDYSSTIPTAIINDGNGNNFNLSAFPNFSDLFENNQEYQNEFFSQFFDQSFLTLNHNIDQFNNILNENELSLFDFTNEVSEFFQINSDSEYNLSSAFGEYFGSSFLNQLNLDSGLFDAEMTVEGGQYHVEYSIDVEELDLEGQDLQSSMISEDEFVEFSFNELSLEDFSYARKALMINFETQSKILIVNDNSKINLKFPQLKMMNHH